MLPNSHRRILPRQTIPAGSKVLCTVSGNSSQSSLHVRQTLFFLVMIKCLLQPDGCSCCVRPWHHELARELKRQARVAHGLEWLLRPSRVRGPTLSASSQLQLVQELNRSQKKSMIK